MRAIVFSLTALVVVMFVWQFFGKKGTRAHTWRGRGIEIFSVAIVVINTIEISLKRGISWDVPFLVHTALGSLFFLGLIATSFTGWRYDRTRDYDTRRAHRALAYATGLFLAATLVAGFAVRLFR